MSTTFKCFLTVYRSTHQYEFIGLFRLLCSKKHIVGIINSCASIPSDKVSDELQRASTVIAHKQFRLHDTIERQYNFDTIILSGSDVTANEEILQQKQFITKLKQQRDGFYSITSDIEGVIRAKKQHQIHLYEFDN